MKRLGTAYGVAVGAVLIALLPAIGLLVGAVSGGWQISWDVVEAPFTGGRAGSAFWKSAGVGVVTALLATLAGGSFFVLLTRCTTRIRNVVVALLALGLVVSPYVYTQGWILAVGNSGFLWRWLGLTGSPGWFSLYSTQGTVALLALRFAPLAMFIFGIAATQVSPGARDAAQLFQFSRLLRLRLVWWPALRGGGFVSLLWIFTLAFWSYDVPSMLRQKTFALEVFSCFGSFYDYGAALSLAAPALVITGLASALGAVLFVRNTKNERRLASLASPGKTAPWAVGILAIFVMLSWGIPTAALASGIPSAEEISGLVQSATRDFVNTLVAGTTAGLAAALVAAFSAVTLRCSAPPALARFTTTTLVLCLGIPGILAGIGLAYFFVTPVGALIPDNLAKLSAVFFCIIFPPVATVAMVRFSQLPTAWRDTFQLYPKTASPITILTPLALPQILLLALIGFTLAIQEVPASLLTYPPGTSTLSLTIETMLHFDQPGAVTFFCLLQFALAATVWGAGLALHSRLVHEPTHLPPA